MTAIRDKVDEAIAATAEKPAEPRYDGTITLRGGRVVGLNIPLPMSADEVIELMCFLPKYIQRGNVELLGRGRTLTLPDGTLVPVRPEEPPAPS